MRGEVAGLTPLIAAEDDVKRVMERFRKEEWQRLRIWEYVVLDVDAEVRRFREAAHGKPLLSVPPTPFEELCRTLQGAVANAALKRLGSTVDLDTALRLFAATRGAETSTPELCVAHYERALRLVNLWFYQRLDAQLEQIVTNVSNRVRCARRSALCAQ